MPAGVLPLLITFAIVSAYFSGLCSLYFSLKLFGCVPEYRDLCQRVCVSGENKNWQSHAWIEVGEIIIDITAIQFDEIKEDVIVDYSKNLPFYKSFNIDKETYSVNIEDYDENSKKILLLQYQTILKTLSKICS